MRSGFVQMSSCGQQVKLRTTLITKHTTAALNTPPWLQCTWVGNINKDTDEEEKHRRVLAASDTHSSEPPTRRGGCVARPRADNFRAVMTLTRADIGQDIIVGHHTDDHG